MASPGVIDEAALGAHTVAVQVAGQQPAEVVIGVGDALCCAVYRATNTEQLAGLPAICPVNGFT